MSDHDLLLAKSTPPGRSPITVRMHGEAVERAAHAVFRPGGRWLDNWVRFFQLADHKRFLLNLRVAALLHDIGKANAEFQQLVRPGPRIDQAFRHEHLSALVLSLPDVASWLGQNRDLDAQVITAAVLSHHLKAVPRGDAFVWGQSNGSFLVHHRLDHPDVAELLAGVARLARLSAPPDLPAAPFANPHRDPWASALTSGRQQANKLKRTLKKDLPRSRLLWAVKAALIAADAAGSALPREQHDIGSWVDAVVHSPPLAAEDLNAEIVTPRATQIAHNTLKPFEFRPFQRRLADAGSRTLLVSACGSGKTLAAYLWAAKQLAQTPLGRVVFLYPTRGTATEGFRDYLAGAPLGEAALMHGSARYELEGMSENRPRDHFGGGGRLGPSEAEQRLYSLGYWGKRYFSATADQFLAFAEHSYSALCMLPALADAALIVDEVHSFDLRMFESLCKVLEHFAGPVLCMTATLPKKRKERLARLGLAVYPADDDRAALVELERLETHPRYALRMLDQPDEAASLAEAAFARGERVLWVVNNVDRCRTWADRLSHRLDTEVLCYHSRFRLRDRQAIHQKTVAAFQQNDQPMAAVTTQVCEMSLDLDADLLVSELAPVPSLVQRFGRANRHLKRGDGFRAPVLCYRPPRHLPYGKDELDLAAGMVADFSGRDVSQRDLAEALENLGGSDRPVNAGDLLRAGYYARPGHYREEDDYAAPCILDTDLEEAQAAARAKQPLDGFIVNVPRKKYAQPLPEGSALPPYLGLASAELYTSTRGFGPEPDEET